MLPRFIDRLYPQGLSPEDREYLRRQLYMNMGTSMLENALQGGGFSGMGGALQHLQQAPQQGQALIMQRQQQEQARQEAMRAAMEWQLKLAAEKRAMAAEGRAVEDQERENLLHGLAMTDRERVEGERISARTQGLTARERALQEAQQALERYAGQLGPYEEYLRGEIDALATLGETDLAPKAVSEWRAKFSKGLAEALSGERGVGMERRRLKLSESAEARAREAAERGPRPSTYSQGGVVSGIDPYTGELLYETPLGGSAGGDEGFKPSDNTMFTIFNRQAEEMVLGPAASRTSAPTQAQLDLIQEIREKLIEAELQRRGSRSSRELTADDIIQAMRSGGMSIP